MITSAPMAAASSPTISRLPTPYAVLGQGIEATSSAHCAEKRLASFVQPRSRMGSKVCSCAAPFAVSRRSRAPTAPIITTVRTAAIHSASCAWPTCDVERADTLDVFIRSTADFNSCT